MTARTPKYIYLTSLLRSLMSADTRVYMQSLLDDAAIMYNQPRYYSLFEVM